mgnify:CR=1 FL=1
MKGGSVQRPSALHWTFCGEYHVHLLGAFNIGLGGDEVPAAVRELRCSAAGAFAPFAHAERQARSVQEARCGVHAQRRGPVSYFQHQRTANWLWIGGLARCGIVFLQRPSHGAVHVVDFSLPPVTVFSACGGHHSGRMSS